MMEKLNKGVLLNIKHKSFNLESIQIYLSSGKELNDEDVIDKNNCQIRNVDNCEGHFIKIKNSGEGWNINKEWNKNICVPRQCNTLTEDNCNDSDRCYWNGGDVLI